MKNEDVTNQMLLPTVLTTLGPNFMCKKNVFRANRKINCFKTTLLHSYMFC